MLRIVVVLAATVATSASVQNVGVGRRSWELSPGGTLGNLLGARVHTQHWSPIDW
jgi:hypothetical protein